MNEDLKEVNLAVKEEVYTDNGHKQVHIDNFLQFAPALAVYGLNAVDIRGSHDFKDRTMIYALSTLIVASSVTTLKYVTHQARPDLSAYNSFPSGHTAQAFASAEFMRREYRNVSPWYGVAGYAMATATGYLRMYNNRHWLGDVVAGAGIGIASTDLAYWLYPQLKRHFSRHGQDQAVIMPYYQGGAFGLSMVRRL
jgi:membrane-associated phospholipid phosphatase